MTERLAHVRWIGGGTGAGKSTVAHLLASRFNAHVYDGDRAELTWESRCTRQDHPHLYEAFRLSREEKATESPRARFERMASRHGETIGFVVEDLLALPNDRPVVVDWFGLAPRDVHPLLTWPEQAVFLLPSQDFRHQALATRYADPTRARANWGAVDPGAALANRLARDELWDAEVRAHATELGLPTIDINGTQDAHAVAEDLARRFRLR